MADTVKVTKLGRRRRGRNTLRNIGARDVDKERSARIVAKKAEKLRAKNNPNKKVRKTSAQRRRAAMDEKGRQIKRTTTTTPRLQQTLAGAGGALGMLGGPLAKVVGTGGKVLGAAVAGKVAAKKAAEIAAKKAAAAAKKKAAAAARKKAEAAARKKAEAASRKKAKAAKKKPVKKTKTEKKPVEMSAAARKKAEKLTKGYKRKEPKNKYSTAANARIARDATKTKPKPKPKTKGKGKKAAVTAAASKSKNLGKKLGIGAGLTALGTGAYLAGRKPSDAKPPKPPKKPDNKIDWTTDDEDRIVEQGRTITSNPKGDGSRTGLDLQTILSRIEDREYMSDPDDPSLHDLDDLKADLKELRGYRRGGPVRRSRTTNQFRGWGKARKPKHKMR